MLLELSADLDFWNSFLVLGVPCSIVYIKMTTLTEIAFYKHILCKEAWLAFVLYSNTNRQNRQI